MNFFRKLTIPFRLWRRELSMPLLTHLFGISNPDAQGALAQSRNGDALQIVHVPTERFPYNVYVYSIELNRVLGYLTHILSKSLCEIFGKGFCLDGRVDELYGGEDGEEFGAQIVIFKTTSLMRPYLNDLPYLREELDHTKSGTK